MTPPNITAEAVEQFIQTTLKEAVLSEGLKRTEDDTKDAYATVTLLRALAARNAELEAGLTDILNWRKSCHEYDKENGHDLREFDVEDLKMMEFRARAAIKGASND